MKSKQTAVEWLINEIIAKDWWYLPESMKQDIIEQAKQMEKERIMRSHISGYNSGLENKLVLSYEYYVKTFKSE